jgi:phosphoglycerol transferase MdoB-like AlkP superfamily enzyme
VPPALALLLLPRRPRAWALLGVGLFGSALILADVLYYRFFGNVLSAPAVLAARQTGRVWGTIRSVLTPELLWLIVDWPLAIWLITRCVAREHAWTVSACAGSGGCRGALRFSRCWVPS